MMDAFDVFKIIFGIIISFFIIQFVLQFLDSYSQIGEASKQISGLTSFNKIMQDVYTTGIPTSFTLDDYDKIKFYQPPYIMTEAGTLTLDSPTVFIPAKNIFIYRGELDLHWWRYYFLYAIPGSNVIYIPLNNSPLVFGAMSNLTLVLPFTEKVDQKFYFGFGCNGTSYYFSNWERERFLNIIGYISTDYSNLVDNDCSGAGIPDFYKKIKVSLQAPVNESGIFMVPKGAGMGYVYVDGKPYLYKNPLDIVYVIFGGEGLYEYGNRDFFSKFSLAVDLKLRESQMISVMEPLVCRDSRQEFMSALGLLKTPGNYTSEADMMAFSQNIARSIEIYQQLEVLGCE
jgi:hypothetical protein